ncbi:hypothetical protein E3N88_32639 [Mikania micrantha]|uniref:TORTIFOLIA1/SINE1-2 N-terminal domain-containing protein n=1 Tax=Mikania micrantha TaxID=192012 RepID=A0A5N6M8Z5_9ASTR|nr:hypothetical protein E3N88_32639 [Mikania micrantha]
MKALKSHVKDLDSKAISIFLAQISETKHTRLTSVEYTVTIFEDIARFHGTLIVPHIDNIMLTIIKTLSYSIDPFACSKVVSAIARYGIDPMTYDAKKQEIMHSLCKPLSDSLLARQENVSYGAALCLHALVESDNWQFCSSQMVNEVCQRVTVGLEKPVQGDSHMGLVMALVKCNGLVVEGYARLLVRAGVKILSMDDCQKRLLAIQMVKSLIRDLDFKSIVSELTFLIEEFQKLQNDQMTDVKEAAFEAAQTAKRMLWSNVDVSLKEGLFSGQIKSPASAIESSETRDDHEDEFTGFLHTSPIKGDLRSATASPLRSRSYVDVNNFNLSTAPRKPDKSVQVPDDDSRTKSQFRRFRSSSSSKCNCRPDSNYDQNGFCESFTNEDERLNDTSKLASVIPTNGNNDLQQCQELVHETKVKSQILSAVSIYNGLFVLLVAVVWYLWIRDVDDGYDLVPT